MFLGFLSSNGATASGGAGPMTLTPCPSPASGRGEDAASPGPSPASGRGEDAACPSPASGRGEGSCLAPLLADCGPVGGRGDLCPRSAFRPPPPSSASSTLPPSGTLISATTLPCLSRRRSISIAGPRCRPPAKANRATAEPRSTADHRRTAAFLPRGWQPGSMLRPCDGGPYRTEKPSRQDGLRGVCPAVPGVEPDRFASTAPRRTARPGRAGLDESLHRRGHLGRRIKPLGRLLGQHPVQHGSQVPWTPPAATRGSAARGPVTWATILADGGSVVRPQKERAADVNSL